MMSDTASPRFTYDSRGSVFLGPYAGADREYDLYADGLEQYEAELHAKRYVLEVELSHDKFGGLSASLDELGREVFLAGCRLTQRGVDISRHPPALRLSIDVQAPEALVETLREMVEEGDLPGPAPDALADAASQFLLSVTPRVLISRGCAVSALRLYGDGGDTLLHSLGPQRAPRAGLAPRLGR